GPFGDHTGYYSHAEEFPIFRLSAITMRRDPIYASIVVGKPPAEDAWLGKATERIFLPAVRMTLPEIVDYDLPVAGPFHNCVIVSIRKAFPGHAQKVMHALWGLGMLSLSKSIVVVDEHVDVHDYADVFFRVTANVDPKRDVLVSEGPLDHLDHAPERQFYGGKLGIDATHKLSEEDARPWPEEIIMSDEIRDLVTRRWAEYGLDGVTARSSAPRGRIRLRPAFTAPGNTPPHGPGPSLWPIGFAIGIACLLLGLVISWIVAAIGAIIAAACGILWTREVTREVRDEVPAIEPETRSVADRPSEAPPAPAPAELPTAYTRSRFLEASTLGLGAALGAVVTLPVLGFMVLPSFTDVSSNDVDLGPLDNFPEGEYVIASYLSNPKAGEVSRRTAFVRNNGRADSGEPSFTILYSRCVHL